INDKTIPQLKVEIVAGAANNQLLEERHGEELEERDILYAPDYVANAGGVINVYSELAGWTSARSFRKADEIYDTVLRVFAIAELSRRHDDANVLALPARFLSEDQARQILQTWLDTPFEGGRHERRIEKIEREETSVSPRPNERGAEQREMR